MLMGHTSRVATLVVALLAVAPTPVAVGIENGRIAAAGEASFAVALVKRDSDADAVFCGGALVAPDVVVTAAHCVVDPPPAGMDVVAGRRDLGARGGDRVAVADIDVSPRYDRRTDAHDVATLRLARPAIAGTAVALPAARSVAGTRATVYGWGLTSLSPPVLSRRLRAADYRVRSDRSCTASYSGDFRGRASVCAASPSTVRAANVCEGDSGGPLVALEKGRPVLVGIVSYGLAACSSRRFPEVFAEVAENRTFVERRLRP